jgi:hypothetical protein
MRTNKLLSLLLVSAVVVFGSTALFAHCHHGGGGGCGNNGQINFGDGLLNAHFNGSGSAVVTLLIPNCSGGYCYLASGSASGTGSFQGSGSYSVYSVSNAPFFLTHQADDSFDITQTADIYLSYTSNTGTLTGKLFFSSISATQQGLTSTMTGTLTNAGGTFGHYFPDGGLLNITVGLTFPLQTLYSVHGFSAVEFQNGVLKTACHKDGHNHDYWKQHGDQWQHGDGMWLGGVYYTDSQVMALLQASETNDASMYLAHRLIAATLNTLNNLSGDPVQGMIDDSHNLLGGTQLPLNIDPHSAAGQQMVGNGRILDNYNNTYMTSASTN